MTTTHSPLPEQPRFYVLLDVMHVDAPDIPENASEFACEYREAGALKNIVRTKPAALIVRAVNAHDALINALSWAKAFLVNPPDSFEESRKINDMIKDALALASGTTKEKI